MRTVPFFALALVAMSSGCTIPLDPVTSAPVSTPTVVSAAAPDALDGSEWVTTELESTLAGHSVLPSIRFENQRVFGTGGCNRFSGRVQASGDTLTLGPVAATRMTCPGAAMANETKFFAAVEATRRARIFDGKLILFGAGDAPLLTLEPAPTGTVASPRAGAADTGNATSAAPARNLDAEALARGATLTGRGNEPGWRVEIGPENRVEIVHDYGAQRVTFASLAPRGTPDGARVYEGSSGGRAYRVTVRNTACQDDMSGEPFPATVLLEVDGRVLRGCGGAPGR